MTLTILKIGMRVRLIMSIGITYSVNKTSISRITTTRMRLRNSDVMQLVENTHIETYGWEQRQNM
jgi:hypothetical protein